MTLKFPDARSSRLGMVRFPDARKLSIPSDWPRYDVLAGYRPLLPLSTHPLVYRFEPLTWNPASCTRFAEYSQLQHAAMF